MLMRLFSFRRKPLDLVGSALDDLEQRSESHAADDPLVVALHQAMSASVSHTAQAVPLVVKSVEVLKMESCWT